MKKVLFILGLCLISTNIPVQAQDNENTPCEVSIIEEQQYNYASQLIEKNKLQRDSIYNALNLTPAQIKCKNEIEKKRFEALEPELKKFCLVKKKLKRAEEKCNKSEIANAEKELKPIRKCIRKISSEYDKQFMEILNSEQKAKYRMIRKLKRNDLKKQHKIQKNGQKPSDLKPFGEKISQPAYAEQKHNQTCLWHKMIKKIKKK